MAAAGRQRALGAQTQDLTKLRGGDLMTLEAITSQDLLSHVRDKGGWRGTVTRKRADGTTFPVSATLAAPRDDRGALTHVVSVERDISEERRLREQLIHSERLSAVGQLVAGVAHEINNPLQAVMGLSELLIEGHNSGDQKHDLDQIRVHADRAAKIVRHLLLFARHSALERSVADLNEITRSAVALRSFELKSLGVELVEHYSLDLPLTVVNREEIQQVILNLLMNAEHAVIASGQPGVVRVRTGESGACAWVEVSDNGPACLRP
jgi:two-component system NtrC family sensor kinase